MDHIITRMKMKQGKGLLTSLSTYHRLSLLRARPTPFLHPFLIATPLSNLSIIFFVLDSLQVFLFSHSAEAQHGMQGLGTVW